MNDDFFKNIEALLKEILANEFGIFDAYEMSLDEIQEVLEEILASYEDFNFGVDIDDFDIQKELEHYREHQREIREKNEEIEEDEELEIIIEFTLDVPEKLKDELVITSKKLKKSNESKKDMDQLLDKVNKVQEPLHNFSHVLHTMDNSEKWTRIDWDTHTYITKHDTVIIGYAPITQTIKHTKYGVESFHPTDSDMFKDDWFQLEE